MGKPPGAALGPPAFRWDEGAASGQKPIALECRLIKDRVRKATRDREDALHGLVRAIGYYRKLSESKPLTLQGSD